MSGARRRGARGAWGAAVVVAGVVGCGRGADTPAPRSAKAGRVATPPGPEAAAPGATGGGTVGGAAAGQGACPHDGRWRPCSVVERLEQSGLVPRVDTGGPAPRVPFLGVPATRVRLGRGALHAFVYDDTAQLARDVAALDTVRVAPRGETFDWDVPPTFVRSANLVAVLLTQNEHQIERVRLALEGGPPQPDPDRR